MSDMQRNLLYTYHPCMICIDISVSDMHTTCSGMHTHLLYAYRTQMICVPSTICPGMHIRHGQLSIIQISSVSDMRTRAGGTHIVHVRYAYNQCVCISDTDNMHTRAGSMHIGHRQYAYTF